MMQNQPGRYIATNVTLRLLIRNAYQVIDSIDPDHSTYLHPSGRPLHLLDDTNRITELG